MSGISNYILNQKINAILGNSSAPVSVDVFNNIVYFGNSTITTANKLYYLADSGGWVLASNTNSKTKLVAIARGTDSAVDGMWIASNTGNIPIVVADANIGDTIFISSVAGELTGQQPPGQDLSLVRQVGYKISPTEIKFYLYPIYISPMGTEGYGLATQIGGALNSPITDGGNTYTLLSWTATTGTRTFSVSVAGLFDVMMIGGGGAGGSGNGQGEGGGGGGAGQMIVETLYLPVGTYDVYVGAGVVSGSTGFAGSSGFNLQPVGSAGTLKYEAIGGVTGGPGWGGGTKGYNSGGASYRSGYGGSPAVSSFALYGNGGGASNGSGNNGGGGGMGGAGFTRSILNPTTAQEGGGGAGIDSTFTGVLKTYAEGGAGGGNANGKTLPPAPLSNTGSGGGGSISATNGQAGASGFMAVRFRI